MVVRLEGLRRRRVAECVLCRGALLIRHTPVTETNDRQDNWAGHQLQFHEYFCLRVDSLQLCWVDNLQSVQPQRCELEPAKAWQAEERIIVASECEAPKLASIKMLHPTFKSVFIESGFHWLS